MALARQLLLAIVFVTLLLSVTDGASIEVIAGPEVPLVPLNQFKLRLSLLSVSDPLTIAVGNTSLTWLLIDSSKLASLGTDGYMVEGNGSLLAIAGNESPLLDGYDSGTVYGLFEVLRFFGFAFLHPLQVTIPASTTISVPTQTLSLQDSPRWRQRNFHLHTQHPLELTELLNGCSVSECQASDSPPSNYSASWESMFPEWLSFLEWAAAQKLNKVEWCILIAADWEVFGRSVQRQQRFQKLTAAAREWGLQTGADVPIVFMQQHAFHLINDTKASEAAIIADLHASVDYILGGGFDFISTESGFSEFTHPDDITMLSYMNETTSYVCDHWKKTIYIKAHCSTGQVAKDFTNPWNHEPLNFNFLPIFADPRLGILPHTVEAYSFDDPSPVYGNKNFTYMLDFMFEVAKRGERQVLYYGESAYWVTLDSPVPLFLPIYIRGRLHDFFIMAERENSLNLMLEGNVLFDSGWEMGYWLNDVAIASAMWNPRTDLSEDAAFLYHLRHVQAVAGENAPKFTANLQAFTVAQHETLILGQVGGKSPTNIDKHNGMAYMEGWDAFQDLDDLIDTYIDHNDDAQTIPDKYSWVQVKKEHSLYPSDIQPLLDSMEPMFGKFVQMFKGYSSLKLPFPLSDVAPLIEVFQLRLQANNRLFKGVNNASQSFTYFSDAASLTLAANKLITQLLHDMPVDVDRVTAWRGNPTAYRFTYLWTVRVQYFWWRAINLAAQDIRTPCYLNIQDPVDVAFGEGRADSILQKIEEFFEKIKVIADITDCLSAPIKEPEIPHFP